MYTTIRGRIARFGRKQSHCTQTPHAPTRASNRTKFRLRGNGWTLWGRTFARHTRLQAIHYSAITALICNRGLPQSGIFGTAHGAIPASADIAPVWPNPGPRNSAARTGTNRRFSASTSTRDRADRTHEHRLDKHKTLRRHRPLATHRTYRALRVLQHRHIP